MPGQLTKFMREQLSAAWSDEAFLESAEQIASKSLLKELSADEDLRERTWTFAEPLVHRSAAVLSYLAGTLSIEVGGQEPRGRDALQGHALRLARLWEGLARLGEETPRGYALLNAACAYELAGYQANAACLSRRFGEHSASEKGPLWGLASTFLQRRFVRLGEECAPLAVEPDCGGAGGVAKPYATNTDPKLAVDPERGGAGGLPYAQGLAAAASSLSSLGGFFLTGEWARVDAAAAGLGRAQRLFAASGFHRESALAHTLRALAAPMASRSTWAALGDLAGGHFAWGRYLKLLARGIGPRADGARSVSEMWPSQRDAVEKGLLASSASKIVRMPTSSGKARIAEMCILQALTMSPGAQAKCVYIAPHRALVAEVAGALSGLFPDLGFTVSGLDGAYDDDPAEGGAGGAGADILVATPEKLDLLLRAHAGSLANAALFVLDEGHAIGDEGRGLKMELLLARLRRRFARARFVVLSAMISDGSMRDLASWLCGGSGGGRGAVISTEWRPTLQRHAMFRWSGGGAQCTLEYEPGRDDLPRGVRVRNVIGREAYEHVNPGTGRIARPSFPSPEKSETAAELALKYSALGPVLVHAATKRSAAAVARKLLRRIGLAEAAGRSVPEGLRRREGRGSCRSLRVAMEWLGPGHDATRLLEHGIAIHHGDVPGMLRRAIEEDSRSGAHAVIVAAGAPPPGAEMPIRTVIVHSCRRHSEESGRAERIPAAEYWNLGGRAGRAGRETEGTVIHIVNTAVDKADYDHYRRERKSLGDVDSRLHRLLGDLVEKRISPEEVDGAIDPEVLGMLAEEGLGGSCEDMVGEVVSGTLAAARANGGMDAIRERFREVARSASELGGERVRIYGSTGLGRAGCEAMRSYARKNREELGRILASGSDAGAASLTLMVLDAIESVPEMSGRLSFGGDREALVRAWIGGKGIQEALEDSGGTGDRAGAARFIEGSLGHYAPWGITAFIRIAACELGLDPSGLPPRVRHLAGMVRYGVPSPEACWAMRLGVSTRRAAVAMAADYGGDSNFGAFAAWLGRLGPEAAAERYGPDSNAAGAAAAAASGTRANPLLRECKSMDEVLAAGADVECGAGGAAGSAAGMLAAARASVGDPLRLERDRDAAHDRNAVVVHAGGSVIGRVERDVAQYLAPEMDCGARIAASVGSVSRGAGGAASIRMRLRRIGGGASAKHPAKAQNRGAAAGGG